MTVEFQVLGEPAPKGSKRAFVVKGKAVMVESSARLRPWEALVRSAAQEAMGRVDPFSGPMQVELTFHLHRPKHIPKERLGRPSAKPDLDKLIRAALDAMTGTVFVDDGQVVTLTARKHYTNPNTPMGMIVLVEEIDAF